MADLCEIDPFDWAVEVLVAVAGLHPPVLALAVGGSLDALGLGGLPSGAREACAAELCETLGANGADRVGELREVIANWRLVATTWCQVSAKS